MRVNTGTSIPKKFWRTTITLPEGGTISASSTKNGLTGGSLSRKVGGLCTPSERNANLEGSRVFEGYSYTGLSENISISVLDKIEKTVKSCMDEDHYRVILLLLGSDAIKLILKEFKETFLKLCQKYNMKIAGAYGNQPLDHPQTDGWVNIGTCVIGGHDVKLPPGVYLGSNGNLIDAEFAEHTPFISLPPYDDTQMTFMDIRDPQYQERLDFIRTISKQKISELGLNTTENDNVLIYRVCEIRKDLSELRSLIREKKPKAVVLVLYHSGTANTNRYTPKANVAKLVAEYQKQGIMFFGLTTNGEPTDLTLYETSTALRKAGVIPVYDEGTIAVARIRHAINTGMERPDEIIDFVLPDSPMVGKNRDQIGALKALYLH